MPGPYVTDQDVLEQIARLLKVTDPKSLPTSWVGIVKAANQQAYTEIVSALAGRGFAIADVDNWINKRAYNLRQAVYWSLVDGAGLAALPDSMIERFNILPGLKDVAIVDASGNPITPSQYEAPDSNEDGTTDTWGGGPIVGGRLNQDGYRFNINTEF